MDFLKEFTAHFRLMGWAASCSSSSSSSSISLANIYAWEPQATSPQSSPSPGHNSSFVSPSIYCSRKRSEVVVVGESRGWNFISSSLAALYSPETCLAARPPWLRTSFMEAPPSKGHVSTSLFKFYLCTPASKCPSSLLRHSALKSSIV